MFKFPITFHAQPKPPPTKPAGCALTATVAALGTFLALLGTFMGWGAVKTRYGARRRSLWLE